MIKFNVTLNEKDIKSFIFYKMKIKKAKVLFPICVYAFCFVFLVAYYFFYRGSITIFFTAVAFLVFLILSVMKQYTIFKREFVGSLDLVGKEREFNVNERCLHIIYKKSLEFCGTYFFYDIKKIIDNRYYIYIYFNKDVIVIPKRSLEVEEYKKFCGYIKKDNLM